jgi:Putative DNA-binding domain
MDQLLLESLLFQEESETLDFKQQQYAFSKATDALKAELLKDILAFANAWRQSDAHILIGIQEVRGGPSIVLGINPAEHLLDRNLQQFVSSKTNRPVSFSYQPFEFEGVEVGAITIPIQTRPVYLVASYGHLRANVVYIRRGSATSEAAPDEITRMVANPGTPTGQPVLELELADLATRERFGALIRVQPRLLELPPDDAIPLYGKEPSAIMGRTFDMNFMENRNYYRDVAKYLQMAAFAHPIGLAVSNPSTTVAENVIVRLQAQADSSFGLIDGDDMPDFPSTSTVTPAARLLASRKRYVLVSQYGNTWEVKANAGTVQPGTAEWLLEPFFIGAMKSASASFKATMSADNLRIPITSECIVQIDPVTASLEKTEIMRRARSRH